MPKKNRNTNQDVVSNRLLLLITISFLAALLLMWIYRGYSTLGASVQTNTVVFSLILLFGAAAIGCGFWLFQMKKREIDEDDRTLTSKNCLLFFLVAFVCVLAIYQFQTTAIRLLYVIVPAYVGLYFIKKVFPTAVLWLSFFCFGFGLTFYFFNRFFDNAVFSPFVIPSLLVLVLVSVFLLLSLSQLKKTDGVYSAGKKAQVVLPKGTNYWLLLGSPFLATIFGLCYFILGTPAMRYGLYTIVGYFFLCVLYHTFELMNK